MILSSLLKLPKRVPTFSEFNLPIFSSSHISTPPNVDSPIVFWVTFLAGYFVRILPFEALFFIDKFAKSYSICLFLALDLVFKYKLITSDSLFLFEVRYSTLLPSR